MSPTVRRVAAARNTQPCTPMCLAPLIATPRVGRLSQQRGPADAARPHSSTAIPSCAGASPAGSSPSTSSGGADAPHSDILRSKLDSASPNACIAVIARGSKSSTNTSPSTFPNCSAMREALARRLRRRPRRCPSPSASRTPSPSLPASSLPLVAPSRCRCWRGCGCGAGASALAPGCCTVPCSWKFLMDGSLMRLWKLRHQHRSWSFQCGSRLRSASTGSCSSPQPPSIAAMPPPAASSAPVGVHSGLGGHAGAAAAERGMPAGPSRPPREPTILHTSPLHDARPLGGAAGAAVAHVGVPGSDSPRSGAHGGGTADNAACWHADSRPPPPKPSLPRLPASSSARRGGCSQRPLASAAAGCWLSHAFEGCSTSTARRRGSSSPCMRM
mmetsp:Transcript_43599/g.130732  ORF Transcript_43599/g.130732 Transcript_43599/m.130732 type:complete len:387 (+) Transcript_43599:451-1611(+)